MILAPNLDITANIFSATSTFAQARADAAALTTPTNGRTPRTGGSARAAGRTGVGAHPGQMQMVEIAKALSLKTRASS